MPQLGETVTEGTVTKWMKHVGDAIAEDEVLFEVSTDKVDSEVPSPSAGYLAEILVQEGETVDVGTKLAVISAEPPSSASDGGGPAAPEAPPTTQTDQADGAEPERGEEVQAQAADANGDGQAQAAPPAEQDS